MSFRRRRVGMGCEAADSASSRVRSGGGRRHPHAEQSLRGVTTGPQRRVNQAQVLLPSCAAGVHRCRTWPPRRASRLVLLLRRQTVPALRLPRIVFPALLLCLSLACQPGEAAREAEGAPRSPGDEARELAIAVDRLRPTLTATSWKGEMGDASASLTGYASGDTLRLIREVLDQHDRGRSAARYYYVGPQLRYYEREGDVVGNGRGTSSPVVAKEKVVLAFDERGATVELSRAIDGVTAPLESARIDGVVARAAEVARQWAGVVKGAGG